ncbi:ribonuclease BN [Thiocapsa imhoffii]|uniref:Ribonuclease BN n=1 Tax=Thiocapsa imhoffii TaxID=382777 RepID=A0A9X0WJ21_9GAMM|nr:YihY/virulence factor BrkB family protein [Thiocapsa imhoffii]MBK1645488.1 ribonuclease BN [Thiocapsa imhoffii]
MRDSWQLWLEHNAFSHAGALAFFALFSMAPTLVIVVAVLGLVLGESAAQGEIVARLQDAVGTTAAQAIEQAVLMSRVSHTGLMPTLVGMGALVIGATTVFTQLRFSLNTIWGVRPSPNRSGLWRLAVTRLLALVVVLLIGLALLLYVVISAALNMIAPYLDLSIPGMELLWSGGQSAIAILLSAAFVAILFKVLPDVILSWRDVIVGAVVTALMLAIGRYGIALYLSHTAMASTFGAAASLVIVLFWVYYSALILLLGAAFTRMYCHARGQFVRPRHSAVQVVQELVGQDADRRQVRSSER